MSDSEKNPVEHTPEDNNLFFAKERQKMKAAGENPYKNLLSPKEQEEYDIKLIEADKNK